MEITEYEKCCKILGIVGIDEDEITETFLKRKYHKCCLEYHPDKNRGIGNFRFIEVNGAYDYLNKYMGYSDDENYDDEQNDDDIPIIINPYIKMIGKMIVSNELVISYVNSMNDCDFKTMFKILKKTLY
jgi:preprotein translocase subunit Sec63